MGGDRTRRRPRLVLALALLAASLAVPSVAAAAGQRFSLQLGGTFTITGRTGSATGKHTRAVGRVVLSGRWGTGAAWRVVASGVTDGAGNYRLAFTPRRRGNLDLRLAPPDHHPRRYELHVY